MLRLSELVFLFSLFLWQNRDLVIKRWIQSLMLDAGFIIQAA